MHCKEEFNLHISNLNKNIKNMVNNKNNNTQIIKESENLVNENKSEKPVVIKVNSLNKNSNLIVRAQDFYSKINSNLSNLDISELNAGTKIINYLKLISVFNPELATNQNIEYSFNKGYKNKHSNKNIINIIESSFKRMNALISTPVFYNTSTKVVVYLNFYNWYSANGIKKSYYNLNNFQFLNKNIKKIEYLCEILTQMFKKPVVLNIVKVYKPSYDSNILANAIGLISNKVKLPRIRKNLLKKSSIKSESKMAIKSTNLKLSLNSLLKGKYQPAFLSGLRIRVHGRLLTQSVIPRRTVKIIQSGSLARGKADLVKTARFTNKNKRGAYSITVTTGHVTI
jgi:hypothetical protein